MINNKKKDIRFKLISIVLFLIILFLLYLFVINMFPRQEPEKKFWGVKPEIFGPNFFGCSSIILIKNIFREKLNQNRPFLLSAVGEAICNPLYGLTTAD